MTMARNRITALKTFSRIVILAQCAMLVGTAQQLPSVETSQPVKEQVFLIEGAVQRPGVYRFQREISLLQIITLAGGLNGSHEPVVYAFRPRSEQSEAKVDPESYVCVVSSRVAAKHKLCVLPSVRYDLLRVYTKGMLKDHFSEVIRFKSGSIFYVPHVDVFFVTGDVHMPGPIPYQTGMTLRQAIFLAGNTLETAASHAVIFGIDPQSAIQHKTKTPLSAVMSGKVDDLPICPGDIINIPNRELGFDSIVPLSHLVLTSQAN
jgi:protein involved in polysaccharide export with SLBB domain